jgi:peptide subunit release factor 1 (eRF1)
VAEGTTLLEHVARERLVGVLLVRLGGHAAGVFRGARLEASKVDRRLVHGRHRAGGQSANRFRRRRDNEERDALAQAAATAEGLLVPRVADLEAVVTGGDRRALARVLADPRLAALRPLVLAAPVLDVPDPRREVLERAPEQFLATTLTEGGS